MIAGCFQTFLDSLNWKGMHIPLKSPKVWLWCCLWTTFNLVTPEHIFTLWCWTPLLILPDIVAETNPLDYVYRSMGVELELMQEEEVESQYLLNYIHRSSNTQSTCEYTLG